LGGSKQIQLSLIERWCRVVTAPSMRDTVGSEQQRQISATILFTLTGMAIFSAFALMVFRQGNYDAARVHCGVVLTYGAGLGLVRLGVPTVAMYSNIAATAGGIFGAMWFGGGLSAPAVVFLATLPTVGVLSLGKRAGIYGASLGVAVVFGTLLLQALGFKPRYDPPRVELAKRVIESIVLVIEMYVLSLAFQSLADRAYSLLSDKRDEIKSLLDNMRQGVLAFDRAGRVFPGHSLQATLIFKRNDLEGASVIDLLYHDAQPYDLERELFETWLHKAFELGRAGWESLAEMAPDARILGEGSENEQDLKLELTPIFEGDELARVMMLVTDETDRVRLRREIDANKADRERSSARLRRLAATGAHTFVAFLSSARKRIAEMRAGLSNGPESLRKVDAQHFFRHAHTVRGEAKAFDLDELEQPMQAVEAVLRTSVHEADNDHAAAEPSRLGELLAESARAVDEAERRLVELSPIGEAILDQVTVSRSDLDLLTRRVEELSKVSENHEQVAAIEAVARRLSARPFGEIAGQFIDAMQRWAEEGGKQVRFEVSGKRSLIEPALANALPRALAHLLRNAVAHGIETPQRRDELGKPPHGVVQVHAEERDGRVIVTVEDDGAGLNIDALRERGRALGLSDMSPYDLVFENGLSTSARVDSLSGQGVGMGAAREALLAVGYTLEASSLPEGGARFTISLDEQRSSVRRVG
jgi:HPt (histidine-containing phosphotransfer) domain-containing protein